MRVIAGQYKGRRLAAPATQAIRPTSDRLRETLFDILAPRIVGRRFLDAFAGTGAVGIEALSRGAAAASFIERDRRASALIRRNLERCGITGGYTIDSRGVREASAEQAAGRFDIVFLDPPYDLPDLGRALVNLSRLVARDGLLVLEHTVRRDVPSTAGSLVRRRQVRAGDSMLTFYEAETGEPG